MPRCHTSGSTKSRIQLRIAVLARKNGRETHDCFGYFCHENSASFDLPDG